VAGVFVWQGQTRGLGLNNKFWAPTLGGDGTSHDWENQLPGSQSYADWIIAQSGNPATPSFYAVPSSIQPNRSSALTLVGFNTTWTSGSSITITNSLSGITTVTAGTWTQISATSATLTVTAGSGTGTWKLTIDGVDSPTLTVSGGVARRESFSSAEQ